MTTGLADDVTVRIDRRDRKGTPMCRRRTTSGLLAVSLLAAVVSTTAPAGAAGLAGASTATEPGAAGDGLLPADVLATFPENAVVEDVVVDRHGLVYATVTPVTPQP
ncbi:MAG: hypothetical protein ACRCY9_05095, partial [Phycicoccus sp.]